MKAKPKLKPKLYHEWSFAAIGTQWWIGLYEPYSKLAALQQQIADRIEEYDKLYSRFRSDSLVIRLAQADGPNALPIEATPLLNFYHQLYRETDGKVTPLVGQLLADAGYDAQYSLHPGPISSVPSWDKVLSRHNGRWQLQHPALLDFGAAGKGHLVDIVSAMLAAAGLEKFCVDASGDLYCSALDEPLRIGLEDPADPAQVIGIAEIRGQALCASAPNRRRWAGYHHIIDPDLRASPGQIAALWVTADSAMLADGLATALFFTPPEKLQQFRFEYVILFTDGRVQYSAAWPGKLFID